MVFPEEDLLIRAMLRVWLVFFLGLGIKNVIIPRPFFLLEKTQCWGGRTDLRSLFTQTHSEGYHVETMRNLGTVKSASAQWHAMVASGFKLRTIIVTLLWRHAHLAGLNWVRGNKSDGYDKMEVTNPKFVAAIQQLFGNKLAQKMFMALQYENGYVYHLSLIHI